LCDEPGVRAVVDSLGRRLRDVPLLAPDSIVVREIQKAYAPLVTPELLDVWASEPSRAPGREVSSPWPDRIEIRSVEATGAETCRVEGDVIYMTSVEVAQGGEASREPVALWVRRNGAWRISAYERQAASSPEDSAAAPAPEDSIGTAAQAVDVIRRYYAAINAGDFRTAYELWSDNGRASGQTFEEFEAGYAETARVEVEVGTPSRIEPAAGSRYIDVPVVVRAEAKDGEQQQFEGTYSLRRSVVDGATEEQRRWHIYSADISRVR